MITMNIKPVFILSRGAGVFVDQKGELSSYPDGLLDEWDNLLVKLI